MKGPVKLIIDLVSMGTNIVRNVNDKLMAP